MEGYWELLVICGLGLVYVVLVKETWKDTGVTCYLWSRIGLCGLSEGNVEGYWELHVICGLGLVYVVLVKETWKDTGSYILFVIGLCGLGEGSMEGYR